MPENFFPARGCVYAIETDGESGQGFYRLEGVSDLKEPGSPLLILGADFHDSDVIAPMVTTEDLHVLYVFGPSFGSVAIQGVVLLGEATGRSDTVDQLIAWFNEHRTSVNQEPVNFSIGSTGYKIYFSGLSIGMTNPELNIQAFQLIGRIAQPD